MKNRREPNASQTKQSSIEWKGLMAGFRIGDERERDFYHVLLYAQTLNALKLENEKFNVIGFTGSFVLIQ